MRREEYFFIAVSLVCGVVAMLLVGIFTDNAVDTYAEFADKREAFCIVVDAGHGGPDGGAVSCTGVYESMINLDIALRLNDLLQILGFQTYMIRTEDISVYTSGSTISEKKISDLKERVRIIKSMQNPIVVSIHQNYFTDSKYSGAQVFYAKKSEELAGIAQSLFTASLNHSSNRKEKPAKGVYLMEKIECTGILVECGFLSNAEEEFRLRDKNYQRKICCVIASALSQYINKQCLA